VTLSGIKPIGTVQDWFENF
jgi:integrase/recombinase XerD